MLRRKAYIWCAYSFYTKGTKTAHKNKVIHLGLPRLNVNGVIMVKDNWKLIFIDEILDMVVKNSNTKVNTENENYEIYHSYFMKLTK